MTQGLRSLAMIATACMCLAGCQYDRSFMRMDSNSGIPFLGLQLSVDASDVQSTRDQEEPVDALAVAATETAGVDESQITAVRSQRRDTDLDSIADTFAGRPNRRFDPSHVLTSDASLQPPRIRHALPDEPKSRASLSTQQRIWMF
jgi:hypothetical protein